MFQNHFEWNRDKTCCCDRRNLQTGNVQRLLHMLVCAVRSGRKETSRQMRRHKISTSGSKIWSKCQTAQYETSNSQAELYVRMRVTVTSELVIYEDKRFQRNLVTCARLLYQYPLDSLLQISVHLFSIDQHIMRFTMVTICNIVKSQNLHNLIIKWIHKIIWKSAFLCIIKRRYIL